MSSRNSRLDTFYNEQVAAYHRVYTRDGRESVVDHLQNASAVITGAILLLTLLVSVCSPDGTLAGVLSAAATLVWDVGVSVVPAPLLFALDDWLGPPGGKPPMRDPRPSSHAAKSEALRRVMGLDSSGGMMSSIFRARTRALSVTGSVLGLKLDHDRPPGLGNRDNSCYQNSILQSLASLSSMPDYLSTCVQGTELGGQAGGKNVAQTLRSLLSDLNDASNNGRTLWTPSLLKSMSTWTQQDAQEYYSVILDDIDKGAALAVKAMNAGRIPGLEVEGLEEALEAREKGDKGTAKEEGSDDDDDQHSDDSGYQSAASRARRAEGRTTRNPLEGLLAQRVSCVQCGHTDGLSMVPFNCLTLSLGLDKHQHDLYERLDSYSRVETIEGVDCPKCTLLKGRRLLGRLLEKLRGEGVAEEKLAEPVRRLEAVEAALEEDRFDEATLKKACKMPTRVSTTKTKQMVIARPPQSLVVHVNRSVFDPSTFTMMKNPAPVNFPMVLDLGPWCLGSAETGTMKMSETTETTGTTETNGRSTDEHKDDGEEQWEVDPMVSMVAGDLRPSRLAGPIYELRAAVTHYGRHENGHYICYRKYPPNRSPAAEEEKTKKTKKTKTKTEPVPEGAEESIPDEGIDGDDVDDDDEDDDDDDNDKDSDRDDDDDDPEAGDLADRTDDDGQADWWRLSDHNVSKVDEELVMSLAPGVFMLFYECVDPCMVLQPAVDERPQGVATAEGDEDAGQDPDAVGDVEDVEDVEEGSEPSEAQPDGLGSGSGVDGPTRPEVVEQTKIDGDGDDGNGG